MYDAMVKWINVFTSDSVVRLPWVLCWRFPGSHDENRPQEGEKMGVHIVKKNYSLPWSTSNNVKRLFLNSKLGISI